ncbi:hypothetical protein CC85DRAFT_286798 [Cutaneotrichosporon oleaginosum]|uniref:Uncharacterized protein n=1 Tax=Cutaneotrichosporon oleaginosum TaxID=879819 RepID=A0A0J0XJ64_9TREE|nr:uncharacterized protein CC85DRAFT_286798 [Cutaneotrichosporon oleaginosum]KLT41108.1 hypothetical protein CC85DRAFT_286798 [Cutaneotrichosporon oleaginosum]TXT05760.1 hypothetical protein COLE_07080 [Cutaneotrichosporon oleaginosum]
MAAPTPARVLEALREHLEPALLTKRLPSVLQLAVHLSLVRQRITAEAAMLESALSDLDVDPAGMATLHRLAVADGDALFDLSLDMRREQLLVALAAGKTSIVEGLLEQYLPAVGSVADAAGKHIYVRAMEEHQIPRMAQVRAEIIELVAAVKTGEKPDIPFGQPLNELARDMMAAAEAVVEDADEFMGLFPTSRRRGSVPMQSKDNPRKHAPRMTMPSQASIHP